MRISRIVVKGLFGMFDHDIRLDDKYGVTILIGPNGTGKTTILRMISDVFRSDYKDLASVKFAVLEIYLENGSGVHVDRVPATGSLRGDFELAFGRLGGAAHSKRQPFRVAPSLDEHRREPPFSYLVARYVPEMRRTAPDSWLNRETGERCDLKRVREVLSERIPFELFTEKKPPAWLTGFLNSTHIYFIKAQRLIRNDENRTGPDATEGSGHPKYAVV